MNDDALIRLANLKALNLTPKDLSDRVGGRVSYWADLLRGEKSFGEKAARKIEEQLGIPRLSLDTADADEPIPTPRAITEETLPEPDALYEALEVLSKALAELDEEARSLVGHSLSRLAQDPSKLSNISQHIRTLVFTNVTKQRSTDTGGKVSELPDLDRGIGPDDGEHLPIAPAQRGQQK
jgi:transcriptional regulator with XRE-family HTH domain